jgi:hypothetical protein
MAGALTRRSTSTAARATQPDIQRSAQSSTLRTAQSEEGSRTQTPPELAGRIIITEKLAAARYYITKLETEMQQREDLEELEAQIRYLENIRISDIESVISPAVPLVQRAPKIRELPTYREKSIKEAQDFFY